MGPLQGFSEVASTLLKFLEVRGARATAEHLEHHVVPLLHGKQPRPTPTNPVGALGPDSARMGSVLTFADAGELGFPGWSVATASS